MNDARKDSPSFHRNITPLGDKLKALLGDGKFNCLEIGSGSGQHAASFAGMFPNMVIQPTDADPQNLDSIDAWKSDAMVSNMKPAILLDATNPDSFCENNDRYNLFLCFNVIHITPWKVTEGIFSIAERVSTTGARLFFYGPFRIDGEHTSESNVEFDAWLKSKDESFAVRDVAEVSRTAAEHGFVFSEKYLMPANNFLIMFTRA
ncbi:MAG: DUF938 domain-containing protein [Pseudomonadota bacterium]